MPTYCRCRLLPLLDLTAETQEATPEGMLLTYVVLRAMEDFIGGGGTHYVTARIFLYRANAGLIRYLEFLVDSPETVAADIRRFCLVERKRRLEGHEHRFLLAHQRMIAADLERRSA